MNTHEQQRAIAEACGYKRPEFQPFKETQWFSPSGMSTLESCLPDYLNDLNAMHEAEKMLVRNASAYSIGSWPLYLHYLAVVTDEQHPIDATAAQRAEAFLRTIGKWQEGEK